MSEKNQAPHPETNFNADSDAAEGHLCIQRYLDAFLGDDLNCCGGITPGVAVIVTLKDKIHKYFNIKDRKEITNYTLQAMKTQNVYLTMTLQDMELNKGAGEKGSDLKRSASCTAATTLLLLRKTPKFSTRLGNLETREMCTPSVHRARWKAGGQVLIFLASTRFQCWSSSHLSPRPCSLS